MKRSVTLKIITMALQFFFNSVAHIGFLAIGWNFLERRNQVFAARTSGVLVARTSGVPGAGKTTRAIEIVAKLRDRGYRLSQVGFVSFTRQARREAAEKAVAAFGCTLEELEKHGWFRTLHSCCFRLLGCNKDNMLTGDAKSCAWVKDVLGGGSGCGPSSDEDDPLADAFADRLPQDVALQMWSVARNSLQSFDAVWEKAERFQAIPRDLHYADAKEWIGKYEARKRADGLYDFTDLLERFAGILPTMSGPADTDAEGEPPSVPVWIMDEMQDASALLYRVCQRLIANATYVYLMGDVSQAIYSWCGADWKIFANWPVQKEEALAKTWRCQRRIMDLALSIISRNTHPKITKVDAAGSGGIVEDASEKSWVDAVNGKPTLVMARTNRQATEMGKQLSAAQIPWRAVKTLAGWPSMVNLRTCRLMEELRNGEPIGAADWRLLLNEIPSTIDGTEFVTRGTKTKFKDKEHRKQNDFIVLGTLADVGATETLRRKIVDGSWTDLVDGTRSVAAAVKKHGVEVLEKSAVRVGTIHSTKGAQATDVILHTGITGPTARAMREPDGMEEERRVWYTGITRARDRLVLVRGKGENFEEAWGR